MNNNLRCGFKVMTMPAHQRGRGYAPSPILINHLEALSYAGPIEVPDDLSYVVVRGVGLPPGYNYSTISLLIELPPDYPLSPPGVGEYRVFVPAALRYHGMKPTHFYENVTFRDVQGWAWWCYQEIKWSFSDDLISFLEMIRADLNEPQV